MIHHLAEPLIRAVCAEIAEMLVLKNRAYGNSALDPVRIFSRADPVEQLKVRIDDKLSRFARGDAAGEDAELDLIGYLVLLRVAGRLHGRSAPTCEQCGRAMVSEDINQSCRCAAADA